MHEQKVFGIVDPQFLAPCEKLFLQHPRTVEGKLLSCQSEFFQNVVHRLVCLVVLSFLHPSRELPFNFVNCSFGADAAFDAFQTVPPDSV